MIHHPAFSPTPASIRRRSHNRRDHDSSAAFPSSNRFEVLADLESTDDQDHVPSIHHRRPRNSRGTKAGKRLRDARRKKTRHAAQQLDEQLSREIDALISAAIFPSPPPPAAPSMLSTAPAFTPGLPMNIRQSCMLPPPAPSLPMPVFRPQHYPPPRQCLRLPPPPSPMMFPFPAVAPTPLPNFPSTPPPYPALEFNNFQIRQFHDLTAPPTPPPMPTIPAWCPALPAFNRSNMWLNGPPIFYDLSSLSEPRPQLKEEPACQELQIWRPQFEFKPRQQSRFFPSQTQPRPMVKLPPTSCKLHTTNNGIETDARPVRSTEPKPKDISDSVQRAVEAAEKYTASHFGSEGEKRSAATLWNILTSYDQHPAQGQAVPRLPELESQSESAPYLPTLEDYYEEPQETFELANTEVPYAHPNTLVGPANEIATSPYATEHSAMIDSAIYLAPFIDDATPIGMNELITDTDVDYPPPYETLPLTAAGDSVDMTVSQLALPPICNLDKDDNTGSTFVPETDEDDSETTLLQSDAHFQSEKDLFTLPLAPAPTTEEVTMDVAAFLKMGHAKNCWCQDCEEGVPELVDVKLVDDENEEEEWLVCSSSDTESEVEVDVEADVAEKHIGVVHSAETSTKPSPRKIGGMQMKLDDFFPSVIFGGWKTGQTEKEKAEGFEDVAAGSETDDEDEWEWEF